MLNAILEHCGLSLSEQKVFTLLAQRSAHPAGAIARVLGLKRPTVYFILENLTTRGLISKRKKRNVTYYSITNPKTIARMIEEQARVRFEEIRKATSALPRLLNELIPAKSVFEWKGYEIEAFESTDAIYLSVDTALRGHSLQCIWNPQHGAVGRGKKVALDFIARSNDSHQKIQEIAIPGEVTDWYRGRITNPNHEVRELPTGTDLPAEINIVDESVYFASYVRNYELALRIRHEMLYRAFRGIFSVMWEHAGASQPSPSSR